VCVCVCVCLHLCVEVQISVCVCVCMSALVRAWRGQRSPSGIFSAVLTSLFILFKITFMGLGIWLSGRALA